MRFGAACLLSGLIAGVALAGDADQPPPELAQLLDRMAASAGVEANFAESKELSLLVAPLESRGVIYFAPPGKFARFTLEPGFSALIVDGEAMQMREGRNADPVDFSNNPVARVFIDNIVVLWSGDREKLERHYAATFSGALAAWELRLTPRREPLSRVIEAITLRGDAVAVREMQITEKDGDRTVTRFETLSSDRAFAPAELERIFVGGEPLEAALTGPGTR
jgi:outer membrane lipoprotein-sorting protein